MRLCLVNNPPTLFVRATISDGQRSARAVNLFSRDVEASVIATGGLITHLQYHDVMIALVDTRTRQWISVKPSDAKFRLYRSHQRITCPVVVHLSRGGKARGATQRSTGMERNADKNHKSRPVSAVAKGLLCGRRMFCRQV